MIKCHSVFLLAMKCHLLFWLMVITQRRVQASTQSIANCNSNCHCVSKNPISNDTEFRAICKGKENEELVLTGALFNNDGEGPSTQAVYVQAYNSSSVRIENSFVSRWLTYGSCSMDIWNCTKVQFPTTKSIPANSKAFNHKYAGIGIIQSNVNQLPPEIFSSKKKASITFGESKVDSLDIGGLKSKGLSLKIVNGSKVGQLKGNSSNKINLQEILISKSHVGIIEKNSLIIDDNEGKAKSSQIEIANSRIGYIENQAISLGKKVSLMIYLSNIGFLSQNSIKFHEEAKLSVMNNVLGLEPEGLRNVSCEVGRVTVINNRLISLNALGNCHHIENIGSSIVCPRMNVSVQEFINSNCDKNHILSLSSAMENEPITDKQPVTTSDILSNVNLLIILGFIFLILILILIGVILFRKCGKPKRLVINQTTPCEDLYDIPANSCQQIPFPPPSLPKIRGLEAVRYKKEEASVNLYSELVSVVGESKDEEYMVMK